MKKVFLSYIKLYSPFEFHINFGDNARGWFNHERILNRDDVEIYSIPSWKYHVYYSVLCALLYINVYLVYFCPKRVTIASKIHAFFFCWFNNIVVFVIDFYRMRYLDFPQLNLAD